jgi:hypothetical protein
LHISAIFELPRKPIAILKSYNKFSVIYNLPWEVLSPTAPPVVHQQRRVCGGGEASGQGDGQPGGHEQHLQQAPRVLNKTHTHSSDKLRLKRECEKGGWQTAIGGSFDLRLNPSKGSSPPNN